MKLIFFFVHADGGREVWFNWLRRVLSAATSVELGSLCDVVLRGNTKDGQVLNF